ncbi:MAG: hypothetical protein E3J90_07215 [Promethearchaeota archaeon]|nr:MAG: hypothetical protein E3J90_07215 [Candidatus Lokiarchaeota archaeon]
MGMFDTVVFPKPIKCVTCGKLHLDVQTKQFDKTMTSYKVGDIVPTNVIHGVIEEILSCDHGSEGEKYYFDQKCYFVIWHGILIEVAGNIDKAKNKLELFGVGDLFFLYQALFKERNDFQAKYRRLKSWVKSYREFEQLSKEEQQRIRSEDRELKDIGYIDLLPYLSEENPLLSFLEELEESDLSDKTLLF